MLRRCASYIGGLSLLFSCLLTGDSLAVEPPKLDQHFIAGKFRIFYTLTGESAIPADDRDASGVPDRVEDFAQQLHVANRLFCDVLEFTDPLESVRYGEATCIQIMLQHRGKGNGTAFDEMSKARSIPEGRPGERALSISIGNHVDPTKNITPTHEYFHLIQYGSTYFKNRWYLEGMARWSEHAAASGALGELRYPEAGPWPQSEQQVDELFQMAYDAGFTLWNPIAVATDPQDLLPSTAEVRELAAVRYSNGEPALRDLNLRGAAVMREVLCELGKQDDIAYEQLGYKEWSEGNQFSDKNNRYIYAAVMNVLRRHGKLVGSYSAQQ